MSEFLRSLQQTSEQARIQRAQEAQENERMQAQTREQEKLRRQNLVEDYVREALPDQIAKMDVLARTAAEKGELSCIQEWKVQTHAYYYANSKRYKPSEKIEPEVVALESEKIIRLRSGMQQHYESLGMHTVISDSVDGFYEDVLDYGLVFQETHKAFRLELFWGQQTKSQEAKKPQ